MQRERRQGSAARLRAVEHSLIAVRWVAMPFALLQVLTYYLPYPDHTREAALVVVAAFAVGNAALHLAHLRWLDPQATFRISLAASLLEFAIAMGLVVVYTFDVDTAIFAILYLLPLEAAVRFGRRGALLTMAAATVAYTLREVWGHAHYGNDFVLASITYRMGIGFIIAAVVGSMAARYEREHQHVESLYETEREAADALRAANEIRNTFLSAVSHELRTPLTSILGLSATIQRRIEAGDTVDDTDRTMLRYVVEEARRLDLLLADLLDLERLARGVGHGTFVPTDLSDVVRRVAARLAAGSDRTIALDLRSVEASVDEPKVERIVENLLGNAIKYTPPATTVRVATTACRGGAMISVDDEGPGVPEGLRETVFEPFRRGTQASQHAPGTGIGLSLVRRFSELHGGRAWVEERAGGGASFRVFLPTDPERVRAPHA
jgi:signal transduction histidine kinase